jgi:dephospho-CoA kinase
VFCVALTGGIGSGKSTVAERFAALGAAVSDADAIAHALTAPGEPLVAEIGSKFGPGLVGPDGVLDRGALRRLVFADPIRRRQLEALIHPRIRAQMLQDLATGTAPYRVLVIPLLFETGQTDLADRVLVVDLPEEQQRLRVARRSGLDPTEIDRILASQVSRAERLAGADDIIDNSGPAAALGPAVDALHQRYMALALDYWT